MGLPHQPLPPLRDVIAKHGLRARKSLGQNFILDLNLTRRIARSAELKCDVTVVEIGSGPGGLTRALVESSARRVVAIELDTRALDALRELEQVSDGRLIVIQADALNIDISKVAVPPIQIVANLPYNIATKLLLNYLPFLDGVRRMTLTFQKEVASRLSATPGSKQYGRLSVIIQWLCEVQVLFEIPARAFTPEPKVTSCVVDFVPRSQPLAPAKMSTLERLTEVVFSQRRKMLRTSLKHLCQQSEALLEAAGVVPTSRPEEIGIVEFCALARALDAGFGSRNREIG